MYRSKIVLNILITFCQKIFVNSTLQKLKVNFFNYLVFFVFTKKIHVNKIFRKLIKLNNFLK